MKLGRLTLFLLLFPVYAAQAQRLGTIIRVSGTVTTYTTATNGSSRISSEQPLKAGQSFVTQDNSTMKFVLNSGEVYVLGSHSHLKLEWDQGRPLLYLQQGRLRVLKYKRRSKQDLSSLIQTPTTVLSFDLAHFILLVNGENLQSLVAVLQGQLNWARKLEKNILSGTKANQLLKNDSVVVFDSQCSLSNPRLKHVSMPVKFSPVQYKILKKKSALELSEVFRDPLKIDWRSPLEKVEVVNHFESNPNGFFDDYSGQYAPRNGGFIDFQSAFYIAPFDGAYFDERHKVYVPVKEIGAIDQYSGDYLAPKIMALSSTKGLELLEQRDDLDSSDLSVMDNINRELEVQLRGTPNYEDTSRDVLPSIQPVKLEWPRLGMTYQVFWESLESTGTSGNSSKLKSQFASRVSAFYHQQLQGPWEYFLEFGGKFINFSSPSGANDPALTRDSGSYSYLFSAMMQFKQYTNWNFLAGLSLEQDFFLYSPTYFASGASFISLEKKLVPRVKSLAEYNIWTERNWSLIAQAELAVLVGGASLYNDSLDWGFSYQGSFIAQYRYKTTQAIRLIYGLRKDIQDSDHVEYRRSVHSLNLSFVTPF